MWHYIIVILLLSCPFRACIVHLNNQPKQSQQANVSSVIHIENPISPVGHVGCTFHSVLRCSLLNSHHQMLSLWFKWKTKLILFWVRKCNFEPVKPVCGRWDSVISCNLRQALENKLPCKTLSSCEKILTFLQGIWKFSCCILAFFFFYL